MPVLLAGIAGCVSTEPRVRPADLSAGIEDRTGYAVRTAPEDTVDERARIPDSVDLDDGLAREEAVAIALWNNPGFRAELTTLGIARAEIAAAGVLPNPVLAFLLPWGPKQLEASLRWPIEALWQRPRRVELAQQQMETVAERLIESGLGLAGEVKLAHAELAAAQRRAHLAGQRADIQAQIADIAEARLRAGDTSALVAADARVAAIDAARGAQEAVRDVGVTRERLAGLLGVRIDAAPSETPAPSALPIEHLIADALAARPDLRAAEMAIEAAGRQLGLAREEIWRVSTVLDANGSGSEGFEMGPGLDLALPIFNQNQGGVSRAQAEMERAAMGYLAVRASIDTAVREAYVAYVADLAVWHGWRDDVLPALRTNAARTGRALAAGNVSRLDVLASELKLVSAAAAESEARGSLQRSRARLERAVGRNLSETGG